MKTINKVNSIVMIAAGLLISSAAQGQDKYKTNESVGRQLIENSVPGLKYGPESTKKQEIAAAEAKQNTKGNIRDIIFTNGVPAPASKTARAALGKSASSKLPSDAKAPEKEEKKAETPKLPPMQTEVKSTAPKD